MNKYIIYKQDAINGVKDLFQMGDCYCDEPCIIGMLNSLPSVQQEPKITMCKECANALWDARLPDYGFGATEGYCRRTNLRIFEDDFCSRPKRRTNERFNH